VPYNDKLILTSALCKSRELKASAPGPRFFASLDKSDLEPTPQRPKLARYYNEAGLVFVPNFILPDPPRRSAKKRR
jgi:hypothetical protein